MKIANTIVNNMMRSFKTLIVMIKAEAMYEISFVSEIIMYKLYSLLTHYMLCKQRLLTSHHSCSNQAITLHLRLN